MKIALLIAFCLILSVCSAVQYKGLRIVRKSAAAIALALTSLSFSPSEPVGAVSGGGKDFATKDIKEQNFSNQNLRNLDFTQCDGQYANFKGTKLSGARFFRANLANADFTGADLSGTSLEDTNLLDATFNNANMQGSYLSRSIEDAKSLKGADLTDALMLESTKKKLCARPEVQGTDTADTLFCD